MKDHFDEITTLSVAFCRGLINGLYLDSLNNIDRSSSSLLTPPYAKQLKNIKQTH